MITTANKAWPDLKSASVTLHRRQTFRRIQQSCKRQLISNTLMSNTNTNTLKSDQLTELQTCKMLHISNTMTIDHAEMNNISPGIIFQKEFHEYQHFHIKPIPQMSENMECWQLLDIYYICAGGPIIAKKTVRNLRVFHSSLHIIPCASILHLLKKSSSSQSGGSNGQNYLTTKMRRKISPSVANFLPLWPDEMTKSCTAEDFVPQAIWVEGGRCSIYSLGREKKSIYSCTFYSEIPSTT